MNIKIFKRFFCLNIKENFNNNINDNYKEIDKLISENKLIGGNNSLKIKNMYGYLINSNYLDIKAQYGFNSYISNNLKSKFLEIEIIIYELMKNNYLFNDNALEIYDFFNNLDKSKLNEYNIYLIKFIFHYKKSHNFDEEIYDKFINFLDNKFKNIINNSHKDNDKINSINSNLNILFYLSSFKLKNIKFKDLKKSIFLNIENEINENNCFKYFKIIYSINTNIKEFNVDIDYSILEKYIRNNIENISFNVLSSCFYYSSLIYFHNYFKEDFYDFLLEEIEVRLELNKNFIINKEFHNSLNLVFSGFLNLEKYKPELFRKINELIKENLKDRKTSTIINFLRNQKRIFLALYLKNKKNNKKSKIIKQSLKNFNNDLLLSITDSISDRSKDLLDKDLEILFDFTNKTFCKNKMVLSNLESLFLSHNFKNKEILDKISKNFNYIFTKKHQIERISNLYDNKLKLIN